MLVQQIHYGTQLREVTKASFHYILLPLETSPRIFLMHSFFKFILFIYFCLHWVFVAVRRPSLVVVSGGYSSLQCAVFSLKWFSCCGAWALGAQASVVVAHGLSSCGSRDLECRFSSCGTQA